MRLAYALYSRRRLEAPIFVQLAEAHILVQVTIYGRLWIARDLDQSEASDVS